MLNLNAKKWVEALRSGRFLQGTGKLCRIEQGTVSYCCLGVACEVARENGITLAVDEDGVARRYDGGRYVLPIRVQEWLGLRGAEGTISENELGSLVLQNDAHGRDFAWIADLIESEPEGLFTPNQEAA